MRTSRTDKIGFNTKSRGGDRHGGFGMREINHRSAACRSRAMGDSQFETPKCAAHRVALPARFCENGGYKEIHDFCNGLGLCTRGHSVYDGEWFHVYCFAEADHAAKFKERFGGVAFNPSQRGKGGMGTVE